jgi:hypothetical protein
MNANKFHNNINLDNAAITCFGGRTSIENNYICNNSNDSASCGIWHGGGGIHIAGNQTTDTFTFIVRNNLVANNFCSFRGGGMYISACNAMVLNNHFINNTGLGAGAAIFSYQSPDPAIYGEEGSNHLTIKNNLFYGNVTDSFANPADIALFCDWKTYFTYENNWAIRNFSANVLHNPYYDTLVLSGDTVTNVIGTNPGLVAPTSTANVTESAMTADFRLLATSSCIDNGSTSAIPWAYYDYANNYRIYGAKIDIGAYEYGASSFPMSISEVSTNNKIKLFPNPATSTVSITTPVAKGTIQLRDIAGRQIAEQHVTNATTSFDVHDLPRGMYLAIWTAENGERVVEKVVLE